jgi:hypothetical protein
MIEPAVSRERDDVNPRAVLWTALGLALCVAVTLLTILWLENALGLTAKGRPRASTITIPSARAPAPELQRSVDEDLKILRAEEDATLNGYGWIDRQSGRIRIPIQRAKEILLQRGLPVTGTAMPPPGPAPAPPTKGGVP